MIASSSLVWDHPSYSNCCVLHSLLVLGPNQSETSSCHASSCTLSTPLHQYHLGTEDALLRRTDVMLNPRANICPNSDKWTAILDLRRPHTQSVGLTTSLFIPKDTIRGPNLLVECLRDMKEGRLLGIYRIVTEEVA